MQCPNCSAVISDVANFCDQCGMKLHTEIKDEADLVAAIENIDTEPSFHEDMMLFVDKNNLYYENKWQQMELKKKKFSFNLAAFILSFFWLGSRKMYHIIVYIAIFFLFTDIVMYFSGYEYNFDLPADPVDQGIGIAVMIFLGFYGNTLYKNYANKNVALIRDIKGNTPKGKYSLFKSKGGRVWYGAILGLVILFAVYWIPAQFIPFNISPLDEVKFSYYVDPDETFDDVFANIFVDGEWTQQERNDTYAIVDHDGKLFIDEDTYNISVRFKNTFNGDLDIVYVAIDGEALDEYDSYDFLDYYYSEHGYAY